MDLGDFALPAMILSIVAALILLVSYDWRLSLSALGLMYVGVFALIALSWPLEMAVAKLVSGWISASVLGMSLINIRQGVRLPLSYSFSEVIFRISSAGLVALVAYSLSPGMQNLLVVATAEQVLCGLVLAGLGILQLGFTAQPLRSVIGLLTILAGFEILYATVESSVLVAGFLSAITMGFALIGAYLLMSPSMEVRG